MKWTVLHQINRACTARRLDCICVYWWSFFSGLLLIWGNKRSKWWSNNRHTLYNHVHTNIKKKKNDETTFEILFFLLVLQWFKSIFQQLHQVKNSICTIFFRSGLFKYAFSCRFILFQNSFIWLCFSRHANAEGLGKFFLSVELKQNFENKS